MEGLGVMVETTGWPPGLLQDDCRALSKWFAGRLGARRQIKEMNMGAHSTLRVTRSRAIAELAKALLGDVTDERLEKFMDDLLDERLYNAIIVPDGEPNNDDMV